MLSKFLTLVFIFGASLGYAKQCRQFFKDQAAIVTSTTTQKKSTENHLEIFKDDLEFLRLDLQADLVKKSLNQFQAYQFEKSSAPLKIELMLQLGFKLDENQRLMIPAGREWIPRFHRWMTGKGLSRSQYIAPGLVYKKESDTSVEFRLIDPTVDPRPRAEEGWVYLRMDRSDFNLPSRVVIDGLRRGIFPLIGSAHDFGHQIGFMMNHRVTQKIAEAAQSWPVGMSESNLNARLYYVMEYSSFFSPERRLRLVGDLQKVQGFEEKKSRQQIVNELNEMTEPELFERAKQIADLLQKNLVDFGGANVSTLEKINWMGVMLSVDFNEVSQLGRGSSSNYRGMLGFAQSMIGLPSVDPATHQSFSSSIGATDAILPVNGATEPKRESSRIGFHLLPVFIGEVSHLLKNRNSVDQEKIVGAVGWWEQTFKSKGLVDFNILRHIDKNGKVWEWPDPIMNARTFDIFKEALVEMLATGHLMLWHEAYGFSSESFVQQVLSPQTTKKSEVGAYLRELFPNFAQNYYWFDDTYK